MIGFESPRAEEIFCGALEISDAAGRLAFIAQACAGDADTRAAVEQLLVSHVKAERFFRASEPALAPALAAQQPGGYWNRPGVGLMPFYRGTVWAMNLLADVSLPAEHPAAQSGAQHLWERSFDGDGNVTPFRLFGIPIPKPLPLLCLAALALYPMIVFDRGIELGQGAAQAQEEIMRQAVNRLAEGSLASEWRCLGARNQPCGWAAAKALRAFAALPERSGVVAEATEAAIEALLGRPYWDPAHFAAHNPDWARFAFPRYHQTDLLEIAETMVLLGRVRDPRLAETIALIEGKQSIGGRWLADTVLAPGGWARLEEPQQPSKWVTLRALRVLKAAWG
jgi:hypothetical protein